MKFGSNVFQGVWKLARGRAAGMAEFGGTQDAFSASLAPLIAFPLVLSVLMAVDGDWRAAILAFLSQLCVALALPAITQAYARLAGKSAFWLRTATALNWSFWICVPLFLLAGVIGAMMVKAGVPERPAEIGLTGAVGLYMLWYHWFTVRAGLGLGPWRAALLVLVSNMAIALLSIGPDLIDYAFTGHMAAASWVIL